MSTADVLASQVFTGVTALMNDVNQNVYSDAVIVPYLNIALQELQEEFALNNVPVTDTFSAIITVPAGYDKIVFNATAPAPELPDDLLEPQIVWQGTTGHNSFSEMRRVDNLPQYMDGIQTSSFGPYVWQSQELRFFPSHTPVDIKIDYIRNLFTPVTDGTSPINIIDSLTFLQHRTAGLCAQFIGENPGRAEQLNSFAVGAMDKALGIGTKGRQAYITRRRPFRSSFKRRG